MLFFAASVDGIVGIILLQLIYAGFHPSDALGLLGDLPVLVWTVLAISVGVLCGIIFVWLTRGRTATEELALFLMGITAFAAGAAIQLQLSPLFVSVIMGAVVANLVPDQKRVLRVMAGWEKPAYVILLILAGALVQFPTPWIIPLGLVYAILRAALRSRRQTPWYESRHCRSPSQDFSAWGSFRRAAFHSSWRFRPS